MGLKFDSSNPAEIFNTLLITLLFLGALPNMSKYKRLQLILICAVFFYIYFFVYFKI